MRQSGATRCSGHRIMASKKRGSSQAKPPTQKQVKADLARLKKAGLYTGDLRKKPTRYALGQVRKYRDVLDKKSKVIVAPSQKEARAYKGVFKTKFRKIVVPVKKGERVFYSKKSGELFSYRSEYGRKVKRRFPKERVTLANIDNLPQGRNITYAMPIGIGGAMERMTLSEVKAFAKKYSKSTAWQAYLEIIEDEDYDDNFDDADYGE